MNLYQSIILDSIGISSNDYQDLEKVTLAESVVHGVRTSGPVYILSNTFMSKNTQDLSLSL